MELKEFVKNVLIELNWALDEVKEETWYTYLYGNKNWDHINFDINIQVEEWKTLEAGAKLKVLWVWLWTEWTNTDKINNSHRVSFSLSEKWKFTEMDNSYGVQIPKYKIREYNQK